MSDKFFDSLIVEDGEVDSKWRHIAVWAGIGLGILIGIKILGFLILPVIGVGAWWLGTKTYEADVRINGSNDASS